MALKEQVLAVLEESKGNFVSGEALAEKAAVSRGAVWKAVEALRKDGFDIQAIPNKGYCLAPGNDLLSEPCIAKYLPAGMGSFKFQIHRSVASTNKLAWEAAGAGAPEGLVILAEAQSAGKGRMNRSFYSPEGSGIYLSLVLRPRIAAAEALSITTAAATAVANTIESVTACQAGIKWVNDIFCHGRKVSGILTEASFDLETGSIEYAVLGIGINVHSPQGGFPEDLRTIAGAILTADNVIPDVRCRLVAEVLASFWRYYLALPDKTFLGEYQRRSILSGKRVMVHGFNETRPAQVIGIDDDCRLVVRYDDDTQQSLSTGEVSVRLEEET